MRRFMVLVTVGMLIAAMMVFAGGPASAEAGCKLFGEGTVAWEAQHEMGVGEEVSEATPEEQLIFLNAFKEVC